jgi:glycosyltransferase involved in cell wall biosynthesis
MSDSDALYSQLAEASVSPDLLEQTEGQLRQTRFQLQQRCAELEQRCIELDQCEAALARTQQELTRTQAKLAEAQATHNQLPNVRSRLKQRNDKLKEVRATLQRRNEDLHRIYEMVQDMERSKFWKLRMAWGKLRSALGLGAPVQLVSAAIAPLLANTPGARTSGAELAANIQDTESESPGPGSGSQQPADKPGQLPVSQSDRNIAYQGWVAQNTPTAGDLEQMAFFADLLPEKPLFSIIVPTYNTPEPFLREAIQSVLDQVYPYWELCIADDASTRPHVRRVLEEFAQQDARIKVTYRTENGHISHASNSALELATGDFIALLDHDDRLAPEALYEVAYLLNQNPDLDMIYSDEDKLDEQGNRCMPFFKPDWSPDLFLSQMYTCHLGIYRRQIVEKIGGFRPGYEGSQDYDLVLRFTEQSDRIAHIPKILYHWRIHPESAASGSGAKPYAYLAGQKALEDTLQRRGVAGRVVPVPRLPGLFTIRYDIQTYKKVSIIIPTRDQSQLLSGCLESIFTKSTYPNYEVLLIDNGSVEPDTQAVISHWQAQEPDRFRCIRDDQPFNFSRLNNFAVTQVTGDFLLFLNNDTEVITPDWLEAMVEQAQRPGIGAVGAILLYDDDTIQHAGIIMGICALCGHSHKFYPAKSPGYFSRIASVSNYSAVTAACLMCRREAFEAVGGFDEELEVAYNDVDLCLKLVEQGYRNVCLGYVRLYHFESKTRGYEDTPTKRARFQRETALIKRRWPQYVDYDPCYNPNLTRHRQDFSIRLGGAEETVVQDLSRKLRQANNRVNRLEQKLEQTQAELDQYQGRIAAMETSKFWKIRSGWVRLKQSVGLPE